MQRITITADDDLVDAIDAFMASRGYANRSEAIRDLARAGLDRAASERPQPGPCVAALVYTYDHHARDLPKKLVRGFHEHHDVAQTTLHVHIDHDTCMEVAILRGDGADVQAVSDHVIAERGVRNGRLVVVSGGARKGKAKRSAARHHTRHD